MTASMVPSPPMAITVLNPSLMAFRAIRVASSLGLANATSAFRPFFSKWPITNFKLSAAFEAFPAPGLVINLTRTSLSFFDILYLSFLKIDLNQRVHCTGPGNPYCVTGENIGEIMTSCKDSAKPNKTDDKQSPGNHNDFPKRGCDFGDQ